ncbi:MAG: helix-turn-helix domain-containing protein [Clostridia bacterium]|nr:helix-turn-helix domain-containing protein [Clostridia bacterium]
MGKYIVDLKPSFYFTNIRSAWDFNWDSGFATDGEQHQPWEIVYVVSGNVTVTEDSRVYNLREGNLIIHAPMEFHTIKSANGTSPHVYITALGVEGSLPLNLTDGVFLLTDEEKREYEAVFSRLNSFYDNYKEDCLMGQECISALSSFLIKLSRSHRANMVLSKSRAATEYNRIASELATRLYENITIDQLAASCNCSVSNMKILFKKYCGIGPKMYYDRLRCSEAIRLLHEGLSAAEISYKMNFSSPSYFNTFFKRMAGIPPMRYNKISEK